MMFRLKTSLLNFQLGTKRIQTTTASRHEQQSITEAIGNLPNSQFRITRDIISHASFIWA